MDFWYSKDKWVAFIFWQLWTFADIKCQQPNKITLKPQQKQHKSEFFHALVAPKLLSLPLGPTLASREWSCTIRSSLTVGSWLAETRIWNNIPVPPLEINTPILRPLPVTQNKTVFFFTSCQTLRVIIWPLRKTNTNYSPTVNSSLRIHKMFKVVWTSWVFWRKHTAHLLNQAHGYYAGIIWLEVHLGCAVCRQEQHLIARFPTAGFFLGFCFQVFQQWAGNI